jgi:hypothetical protein
MTTLVEVAICGIPLEVVKTERVEPLWCFGERKRIGGAWTLRRPSLRTLMETEAWGWADPVWTYECDGCGQDRMLGFGRVRTWGAEG